MLFCLKVRTVIENVFYALGEQTSPEDTQDQATELTTEPRVKLREGGNGSYSPARHMQMRISYAEVDGGGKW